MLADHVAQVALTGDETHNRHRPVGPVGFHQFDHLVALAADEGGVAGFARQPQYQLVEEQDQRVVTDLLGVGAQNREAIVEIHEFLGVFHRREVGVHQIAHQLAAFF